MGSRPRIVMIAAMAHDRVIGRANAMPWHLPADLAHFKRHTLDKPIIMGRRTWESLPGLLPRRRHIVVSTDPRFAPPQAEVARSPQAAVDLAAPAAEIMIVGGASIYQALLPRADRMLLTLIDAEIDGDACFPAWSPSQWREIARERRPRDAANPYDLEFVTLERRAGDKVDDGGEDTIEAVEDGLYWTSRGYEF
jgi:dihydrofolate reductase